MRSFTTVILLTLALACAGCSALRSITPVSEAEIADRIEAQAEFNQRAVEAAEEGSTFDALLYSIGAAASSLGLAVGLSRRRRARAALARATGSSEPPSTPTGGELGNATA